MSKLRKTWWSCAAFLFAACITGTAIGSNVGTINPDASLWSGGVSNPEGDEPVPAVVYEPDTGLVYLNSGGLNGKIDTTSGGLVSADDIGMISLSIEGPEPVETLLDGFVFTEFEEQIGGVSWVNNYFSGKQALFGAAAGAEYLDPSLRIDLYRYATGLGADDFGQVEMGLNFQRQQPGGIIFGGIQIKVVPEPGSLALILIATGMAFLWRRQRASRS